MFSKISILASSLLFAQSALSAYTVLQEAFTPGDFFSRFNFYTGRDPTNGHVRYIDETSARNQGLIRNEGNSVYMGVDHWNQAPGGRQSVRIESKTRFTRGLFILDLSHMPSSTCGLWPAFWTLGDNWPNNGEIDIIEGVHRNVNNHMALHTSDGCSINGSGQTGNILTRNCFVSAPGQSNNQGCSSTDTRGNSYGDGLNNGGGGVYAMEWNSQFIKIWFFPRGQIPGDALNGNPAPENWGTPAGLFQGNCNIDQKFISHKIIFNITFCGDWAGNVWGQAGCQSLANTCNDYVSYNPGAFNNAYWRINSLKVWSR